MYSCLTRRTITNLSACRKHAAFLKDSSHRVPQLRRCFPSGRCCIKTTSKNSFYPTSIHYYRALLQNIIFLCTAHLLYVYLFILSIHFFLIFLILDTIGCHLRWRGDRKPGQRELGSQPATTAASEHAKPLTCSVFLLLFLNLGVAL